MSTRIVLCDDHAVLRGGLRALLAGEPGLEVVGEAGDGAEGVERVVALRPQVALLDITMPGMSGIEAARAIHRLAPEVKVLMLTMHDDPEYLFQALEAGAAGYVLKRAADVDLVEAIRRVVLGEAFLAPAAARALVADYLARRQRGRPGAADLRTDQCARPGDRRHSGQAARRRCGVVCRRETPASSLRPGRRKREDARWAAHSPKGDPSRAWKLSAADWLEREHWDEYQAAYEDALTRCNTAAALAARRRRRGGRGRRSTGARPGARPDRRGAAGPRCWRPSSSRRAGAPTRSPAPACSSASTPAWALTAIRWYDIR
jgi:DNA-binding NarL/FixJ family response regulator